MRTVGQTYLVFDVESIGLHGEGFAVGAVVVDKDGEIESFNAACSPAVAGGSTEGHEWVRKNCPPLAVTHDSPGQVRHAFWRYWLGWRDRGALLLADCGWPVEARFLAQCVDDSLVEREFQGPYPLHDLATFLLLRGLDPLTKRDRNPDELPEHDPRMDARQSGRILRQCLTHRPI